MGASLTGLRSIRRLNLMALGLLSLASLLDGRTEVVSGVIAGGVTSVLNFELLARMGSAILGPGGLSGALVFGIMFKFAGLMLLVGVLLTTLPLDPIAFAVGFSVIFLAIGAGGMLHLLRGSSQNPESTDA